jgi:hypothetical protein
MNEHPKQRTNRIWEWMRHNEDAAFAVIMAGVAALFIIGIVSAFNYAASTNTAEERPAAMAGSRSVRASPSRRAKRHNGGPRRAGMENRTKASAKTTAASRNRRTNSGRGKIDSAARRPNTGREGLSSLAPVTSDHHIGQYGGTP